MKKIENQKDLQDLLQNLNGDECILRVYDNKSEIVLQTVVIKHPVIFIRGIQEFSKEFSIPISDLSVRLVGFISKDNMLNSCYDVFEISPYVYFSKPKEDIPVDEE